MMAAFGKSPGLDGDRLKDHLSAPLRTELNRLENELKGKDLELEKVNSELKGLRLSNISMEKAIVSLNDEVEKLKEKLYWAEEQLDSKTLELKKTNDLKRAAISAQHAAEATMRRLQAAIKDDEPMSLEMALAPLEAELKLAHKEVAKLTEDNKAQERLMRTKEVALMEAEKTVEDANARLKEIDDLNNKNHELAKQIESLQEENKTLDRLHKQKIEEVHMLTSQVDDLKESLAVALGLESTVKDYQRQLQDMQASYKALQEELARAKVAVSRVAVAAANDWKDDNDKVMPVKQWLEERRFMMGDMDKVKEKLAHAEKSVKYEHLMKEKLQQRIKVLEESLRASGAHKASSSRSSLSSNLRQSRIHAVASQEKSGAVDEKPQQNGLHEQADDEEQTKSDEEDVVPGVFYDVLQKEVIALRKGTADKEQSLKDRDDAIEMLSKKVELLTKALDVETKKSRREISALEKELSSLKSESSRTPARRLSTGKGLTPSNVRK